VKGIQISDTANAERNGPPMDAEILLDAYIRCSFLHPPVRTCRIEQARGSGFGKSSEPGIIRADATGIGVRDNEDIAEFPAKLWG
jgi:hypothetical protein